MPRDHRPHHFVAQRRTQRDKGIGVCAEDLFADLRAEIFFTAVISCRDNVFDSSGPLKVIGIDHERRMGRVNHLVMRLKLLRNITEKVFLRFCVQSDTGVVQQYKQIVPEGPFNLGEPHEERKEPCEACAPLIKIQR